MTSDPAQAPPPTDPDVPRWFRQPNPREHRIAGFLFIGFGIFFILLFIVLAGWWFRWVILSLGVYSILAGIRHLRSATRRRS